MTRGMDSLDETPPKKELPFWRAKTLAEMTDAEWESLCDGCGRCCLLKLEDEDTGEIHATDIGCALFDAGSCRCTDYHNRSERVSDCVRLTPQTLATIPWLPATCGYRLVREGKDLPWWHPLVSGRAETVIEAGISVKGWVFALEDAIPLETYPDRIRQWPLAWPNKARTR
jgi:uncharacterized cysteine cluster protein YcgN (CxxCxxCC family)